MSNDSDLPVIFNIIVLLINWDKFYCSFQFKNLESTIDCSTTHFTLELRGSPVRKLDALHPGPLKHSKHCRYQLVSMTQVISKSNMKILIQRM